MTFFERKEDRKKGIEEMIVCTQTRDHKHASPKPVLFEFCCRVRGLEFEPSVYSWLLLQFQFLLIKHQAKFPLWVASPFYFAKQVQRFGNPWNLEIFHKGSECVWGMCRLC